MSHAELVAIALGSLLLAACPHRVFSFGPRGEIRDPAEILAVLSSRSEKLLRLQSEVSFSFKGKVSASTGGLIAAARPASLRVEIDDFFGNPAAVLSTDGDRLGVYQASTNQFATGPASARNLARLVPVELPLTEAVDLLFGDPRPLSPSVEYFGVFREHYSYLLVFSTEHRREQLEVDTESLLPVHVKFDRQDPYEASFSDFEKETGAQLPQRIEVVSPAGSVGLRYRRAELNPQLVAGLFNVGPPAGAVLVQLPE